MPRVDSYTIGIYYLSIVYAFIIPLSRAGIVGISALLILLWILEGEWKEKLLKLKKCRVFWAFVVFIAYNFLSLIWTNEKELALVYIRKYWYFLPIFVIFTSFPKDKANYLLTAFLSGMLISELLSYGILFELWELRHGTPDNPTPFMNHLDYSIFLAFTSVTLLIKILYSQTAKERLFISIFFITVTANLFITNGRSGQLALLIAVPTTLFLYYNRSAIKSMFIGGLTVISMLILPNILSDTFQNRVGEAVNDLNEALTNKNYQYSWGMRIGAWEVAGEIVTTDPILGVGVEDNIVKLREIVDRVEYLKPIQDFGHYHNQYLEIATSLGLLGLIIFLNIFWQLYKIDLKNRELHILKIAFLTIFLFGFLAEPFLHKQFTMALFTLVTSYFLLSKQS